MLYLSAAALCNGSVPGGIPGTIQFVVMAWLMVGRCGLFRAQGPGIYYLLILVAAKIIIIVVPLGSPRDSHVVAVGRLRLILILPCAVSLMMKEVMKSWQH